MTLLPSEAIAAFRALGDPTRQQILGLLSTREMTISTLR